jgi:murein DD-endopeptidase MepM/ murein hydrolase activator NlpD
VQNFYEGSTPVTQHHDEEPYDPGYDFDSDGDEPAVGDETAMLPDSNLSDGSAPPTLVLESVTRRHKALMPSLADEDTVPLVIPGSGVSMGNPIFRRRQRPLTMRLTVVITLTCLLFAGLISAVPLSLNSANLSSGFQALAGAVISNQSVNYQWYVAQSGDDIETVAARFHVQIGGIMELNNLLSGQDLQIGRAYKIPDDPNYGKGYKPPSPYAIITSGSGLYGNDWWNSYTGPGIPEQPCAPNGGSNPLGYDLQSPNWGSVWIRGFSWFHNGVDIAAPNGNPIRAAQAGLVTWAGWTNTGFGYSVVISHCHNLATLYGHMQRVEVHAGQIVTQGQTIGLEGTSGWSTGPHLHFSVIYFSQLVDPMAYYRSIAAITQKP